MPPKKDIFGVSKAEESTGFLVWQMHNLWQREIKKALKKFDLTHTQFVLLATTIWLNQKTQNVTQVAIARQAQTDVMMTSNVLRTLEKKGWIQRQDNPIDTRAKVISPTQKGIRLAQKVVPEVEAFDKAFFGQLPDEQRFNHDLQNLLTYPKASDD